MNKKMQPPQDINEIPRRSPDYIESKAEKVIECFSPDVLRRPSQTPLDLIASETSKRFKVIIDFSQVLGEASPGNQILGSFRFHPLTIRVDSSLLKNDGRFPFVFAHEYGHFVLHRKLVVKASGYSGVDVTDSQRDLITGKKKNCDAARPSGVASKPFCECINHAPSNSQKCSVVCAKRASDYS